MPTFVEISTLSISFTRQGCSGGEPGRECSLAQVPTDAPTHGRDVTDTVSSDLELSKTAEHRKVGPVSGIKSVGVVQQISVAQGPPLLWASSQPSPGVPKE
jgi:hypothetical protein